LKLITKSSSYFLLFSALAMIAGGMFLYFAIRKDVYRQIDISLVTEKGIIQDQVEQDETIPDFSATFGHQIDVRFLNSPVDETEVIKDTIIIDDQSGDDLPYRYIYYTGNTIKKRGYSITILQALTEKIHLMESISLYTFCLFLTLLFISLLINYLISRRLWSPFYKSVEKADSFNILSDKPLDLPETNIIEFQQLNRVFERMAQKMRSDYLNLKEFNENAAHEIQTPLAIIRSKSELLMQSKNLRKESIDLIKSINEATNKLFKLNQGLLIISKIENQYYSEIKKISLKELVSVCLDNYREIMNLRKIRVEFEASSPAMVEMNEVLADILISNLLSNAVRYNIDKGFIKCHIDNQYLVISNSGSPLYSDPELLFRRFHKGSDNPQSVGLGLSIVRKITDNYKMEIIYTCTGNIHEVKLTYKQQAMS
jgi:signal transduction histidine kinase